MMRAQRVTVAAALLALAPATVGAQTSAAGAGQAPEIETVGTAERRAIPDRAVIMFGVESRGPAAANAATLNAAAVQAVRDALRMMRADTAATTMRYRVGPEHAPPQPLDVDRTPRVIGYVARTTVVARIARIDQLGPAIDAALAAGATGVEGLSFESSNAEAARQTALAEAAAAARRDAETLARAMGGSLGPLLGTSTSVAPRIWPGVVTATGMSDMPMSATQIVPGDIAVHAAVRARWAFIPGR
jgi:uncharacterized protein